MTQFILLFIQIIFLLLKESENQCYDKLLSLTIETAEAITNMALSMLT
jgi:hypothetical protein